MFKKHIFSASGTGGLEFESPHFDQKRKREPLRFSFLFLPVWVMRTTFLRSKKEFVFQTKPSKSLLFSGKCRNSALKGSTSTLRPKRDRVALAMTLSLFLLVDVLLDSTPFAPCAKEFAYCTQRCRARS